MVRDAAIRGGPGVAPNLTTDRPIEATQRARRRDARAPFLYSLRRPRARGAAATRRRERGRVVSRPGGRVQGARRRADARHAQDLPGRPCTRECRGNWPAARRSVRSYSTVVACGATLKELPR